MVATIVKLGTMVAVVFGVQDVLTTGQVQALNTLLNLVTVYLLGRTITRFRIDVLPVIKRLERATKALIKAEKGGRRFYDPPADAPAPDSID